jgi:hypothetical protein
MYATRNPAPAALTSPVPLAAWWATATVLAAWSLRGFPAGVGVAVIAVVAVAAGVLVVLVRRYPLSGNQIRVAAYVCAFVATQAVGVFNAIAVMTPGISYIPQGFGPQILIEVFGGPALSVWTFVLVRAWVIDSRGLFARPAGRSRFVRLSVGGAAAAASLLVLFAANIGYHTLIGLAAVPDIDYPMHAHSTGQWLVLALSLALAGVAEEPVFVGIAVLLWPRPTGRTFVAVWVLTALARAGIHLYYAAGADAATAIAVLLVVLWCGVWSGFNLFLVYRTRRLWPVILAHGLQNTLGFAAALSISTAGSADELLLVVTAGLILGTMLFIVVAVVCFLVMSVRRLWFGFRRTDQVKGRNCPLVQTPQCPPEPQSHQTIG